MPTGSFTVTPAPDVPDVRARIEADLRRYTPLARLELTEHPEGRFTYRVRAETPQHRHDIDSTLATLDLILEGCPAVASARRFTGAFGPATLESLLRARVADALQQAADRERYAPLAEEADAFRVSGPLHSRVGRDILIRQAQELDLGVTEIDVLLERLAA